MADLFHNLALGFGVAVSPINLMLCLIGALVGTLVGVLPGIGTIATVAMLLPIRPSPTTPAAVDFGSVSDRGAVEAGFERFPWFLVMPCSDASNGSRCPSGLP